MRSLSRQRSSPCNPTIALAPATALCTSLVSAARPTLTWTDTAINANGFSIERKLGSTRCFALWATVQHVRPIGWQCGSEGNLFFPCAAFYSASASSYI
jgi:hypothetical protein